VSARLPALLRLRLLREERRRAERAAAAWAHTQAEQVLQGLRAEAAAAQSADAERLGACLAGLTGRSLAASDLAELQAAAAAARRRRAAHEARVAAATAGLSAAAAGLATARGQHEAARRAGARLSALQERTAAEQLARAALLAEESEELALALTGILL